MNAFYILGVTFFYLCKVFFIRLDYCGNIDVIGINLRLLIIAFLATRGVLRILNTACKTLSALITYSSSSVAASHEERRSGGTKKRICLAVALRKKEKEPEFLLRQENGAYIAVDCNAMDRLSPIHPVLPAPRERRRDWRKNKLLSNTLHRKFPASPCGFAVLLDKRTPGTIVRGLLRESVG